VTLHGAIKVLDFGLAAVTQTSAAATDPASSPTLTMGATQLEMLLGTAGYMSPEQARGEIVDKRADIWAFGVVLYEVLTGACLFEGKTVSETLAAVLLQDFFGFQG
jgi:serine/threonine-protein kinase